MSQKSERCHSAWLLWTDELLPDKVHLSNPHSATKGSGAKSIEEKHECLVLGWDGCEADEMSSEVLVTTEK